MNELLDSFFISLSYSWVVVFLVGIVVARDWWRIYVVDKFIDNIEWGLYELKIPKENLKSIKAMEQVVTALHGTFSFGLKPKERWIEGAVEKWMSLEIAGFEDGVRFYIRAPKKAEELVHSALTSHYPGAEVFEVEDYVNRIKDKPFSNKDIWGSDFKLQREAYLPIRTYVHFEDPQEENRVDPLATLIDTMSRLEKNEALWVQVLIRPTGYVERREEGEKAIKEIMGEIKKEEKSSPITTVLKDVGQMAAAMPTALSQIPESYGTAEVKKEEKPAFKFRDPGEDLKMKAINTKLSKVPFETILRIVYIDDKDEFTSKRVSNVLGAIRQFGDPSLNVLVPNGKTFTSKSLVGALNRDKKLAKRKRLLLINYINREMPRPVRPIGDLKIETCILNAEEIATLFHMPTELIESEKLTSTYSRKGQAPTNLPIK